MYIKYKKYVFLLFLLFFIKLKSNRIINDIKRIEKFLIKCNDIKLINEKFFKKIKSPKVSIISAVYNREKYLIRFIHNIRNQKFNDIELIFIDDSSEDNSVKIIENFQKNDERILLIKNKKNKGTFICRNLGVIKSKGEFLILPDPDDILSEDIINTCYKYAKSYNYEMIRFNIYRGKGKIHFNTIVQNLQSNPIFQPELPLYLFYGLGKLFQIDFNVSNKFVKRVSFIRALNCLNKYYLKLYMTNFEDGLMNFFLYREVKSLFFLKKIGYYYIKNKKNIKEKEMKRINSLNNRFYYLKLVFEFTKNTLIEKDICNDLLERLIKLPNITIFLSQEYFNIYNDIINNYIKCPHINAKNKNKLNKLKVKIRIKGKKIVKLNISNHI
jgi:glycosyltransferase involved in cell wall biosynthesis